MSDFLNSLVNRARGFQWDELPPEIVKDKETAVVSDSFDEFAWQMLTSMVPAINRSVREVAQEFDYVPPAYQDLFQLLFQGDPQSRDKREMLDGYSANHSMLKQLADADEFQKVRGDTMLDEYSTAFVMLSMQEQMKEAFRQVQQARERQQQAQQDAQQAQDGLQQAVAGAEDPDADPAQAGQALADAMQQAQQAQEALARANAAQDLAAGEGAEMLGQAAQEANDELQEANANAAAYGVGPGQLEKMSFVERQALTAKLNRAKLAKMAKMFGQWRYYGDAERRRKVKHAPSQIFDVKLDDDLTKLVPTELTKLAIPELEDDFWLKFAQKGLMQWEERGPEKAGQGPIIVVCDESGSMGMDVFGTGETPEMWSKAISMTLVDQAKRGKRDFTYIGFASGSEQWRMDFPKGHAPIEQVIEFVSHFFNGGTRYERPLTMAMEIIQEYAKAGKPKPDIVFITDDDCHVTDEFIEEWQKVKKDADVTVYGIQIGGSGYRNAMRRLADKCIQLSALNSDPEGMTELFRTI